MYTGSWDCAKCIVRYEGISGLYRGLTLSYLGVSEFVLQWVLYERMKLALGMSRETGGAIDIVHNGPKSSSEWVGTLGAAALSKLIAATVAYPDEVRLSHFLR